MKFILPILITACSIGSALVASAQKAPDNISNLTEIQLKQDKINKTFSNLPMEQKLKYHKGRERAIRLYKNKRVFEALTQVHEIQLIFEGDPNVYNLLGALSTELRDFKNARISFKKALELLGREDKLLFNLAEIEFCTNNWQTCIDQFENIKIKNPKMDPDTKALIDYKQFLSYLALSNNTKFDAATRAAYLKKGTALVSDATYMDDTPLFYYTQVAFAFNKDDHAKAARKLMTAKKIFAYDLLASWDDTITEYGYIQLHFGLDREEAADSEASTK